MNSNESLRFAALIRVSTEAQEKRGESLNTQKKQIEEAVSALKGEVYRYYEGQEHATPHQDRVILDRMLADARAGKFDAVMVADVSRWSRDNRRNKDDLEVLKERGIRFFSLRTEHDLNDPSHYFFICMGTEINEYFAKEQARKSMLSRIERARSKGFPTCGKLPYGRLFDETTGQWDIDPEKQKIVQEAARLYLEEDLSFKDLGKKYSMNPSNLCKVLKKRCGDIWIQKFKPKNSAPVEIPTKVPPLLSKDIIDQIVLKSRDRRTWDHRPQKTEYLFSRIIFDKDSGRALSGTKNSRGQRYYKPYEGADKYQINADVIEEAVIGELFEALSCNRALSRAVFDGNPIREVEKRLRDKRASLIHENAAIDKKLANLQRTIELYHAESNSLDSFLVSVRSSVFDMENKRKQLSDEVSSIDYKLSTLPQKQEIEIRRQVLVKGLRRSDPETYLAFRMGARRSEVESYLSSGLALEKLPFAEKRKIVKLFFGGSDESGRRYGVYIRHLGGKPRRYEFEAYGKLGSIEGYVTARIRERTSFSTGRWHKADSDVMQSLAGMILTNEPSITDVSIKVEGCMLGQCDAYHGIGLHQRRRKGTSPGL